MEVGQRIRTNLKIQVENADVEDSLRNPKSESIEGPIWWKIEGKTKWKLFISEEYDVDDLDDGDEPDEEEWFIVPDYPGEILAFKACVDGDDEVLEEDEDEGKGEDIDDPDQSGTTNNCSRTERFRIKPKPEPVTDGTFVWSNSGVLDNMTCTQWKEPSDPHGWSDNFLCTSRSDDIRWSADGPIDGMRCIQIAESADPHFKNNWLCVPNESSLNFVWSESGNMEGMNCVRTDEPNDKHSWDDNYLCWSDSGANGQATSGIYYGAYDTVTSSTGATSADVLPSSVHLVDGDGNIRTIYTPGELPTVEVRIANIGAAPTSAEQRHKLKTSAVLTGPGYEDGWKFSNLQTRIAPFASPDYTENVTMLLPSDTVLAEGLYCITVETDANDKLKESNELNNTSPQVCFYVQTALPDIAVVDLRADTASPNSRLGKNMTFSLMSPILRLKAGTPVSPWWCVSGMTLTSLSASWLLTPPIWPPAAEPKWLSADGPCPLRKARTPSPPQPRANM